MSQSKQVSIVLGQQNQVSINNVPCHSDSPLDLEKILSLPQKNWWKSDENEGLKLGIQLFNLFNGKSNELGKLIDEIYTTGESLFLNFQLPINLEDLPIELLYHYGFLLLHRDIHISRSLSKISRRNSQIDLKPETRALRILFLASFPLDPHLPVLQFEREEEYILEKTKKLPLYMRVEDSGSLEGLEGSLREGAGYYDIVHLSGHCDIDPKLGPLFYLEDETGSPDQITPERLWEALKDFPPRLLFLSGFSKDQNDKLASFASQMVDKGCMIVLEWGLSDPVSDAGAILVVGELYEQLSKGKGIDYAIQQARKIAEKRYYPWPLLRIFKDGSPLNAIVTSRQTQIKERATIYTTLKDSQVTVLGKGFVGRRREIQKGLKVLKRNVEGKYGLIIRGPAGVGKSCLAGKLIERMRENELLVFHGELRKIDVLGKLRELFDKNGMEDGLKILDSDKEYEDKIKALFRQNVNLFEDCPLILYWDDFEQNLKPNEYILKIESLETLRPLLEVLSWAKGQVQIIITSRYPFELEVKAKNLPVLLLEDITLMSFTGANLEKKVEELPNISKSSHKALYIQYGKGNPRLLDWLEKIATEENKYDQQKLEEALEEKNKEYISEYLEEIIANAQREGVLSFLRSCSVFRKQETSGAFEKMGPKSLLEKGVDLTLFEKEEIPGGTSFYWVNPIIQTKEFGKLTVEEQKVLHKWAYEWYDLKKPQDYKDWIEAIYHSLESDNISGACKYVIDAAHYLTEHLKYQESEDQLRNVYQRITEDLVQASIKEKNENITQVFHDLGLALIESGKFEEAIELLQKALDIDLQMFEECSENRSKYYNNLGRAFQEYGEPTNAIKNYENAVEIELKKSERNYYLIASYNINIGLNYFNNGSKLNASSEENHTEALKYYNRASKNLKTLDNSPNNTYVRAKCYEGLGAIFSALRKPEKAEENCRKSLKLYLGLYGERHPDVANTYNNLGEIIWRNKKDANAIDYFNKAIKISSFLTTQNHKDLFKYLSNLAVVQKEANNPIAALENFEKALNISKKFVKMDSEYKGKIEKEIGKLKEVIKLQVSDKSSLNNNA